MMKYAAVALAFLALPATAAQAPLPIGAPPAKPVKQERICREGGERATGSHIRTGKRCMTADQWEIEDRRGDVKPLSMQVNEGSDGVGKPPR